MFEAPFLVGCATRLSGLLCCCRLNSRLSGLADLHSASGTGWSLLLSPQSHRSWLGQISCSARGEHDGDDEPVEGQSLSEDHHENESDQDISLGITTDTSVTANTDAETSGERGETAAKASAELLVSVEVSVGPR